MHNVLHVIDRDMTHLGRIQELIQFYVDLAASPVDLKNRKRDFVAQNTKTDVSVFFLFKQEEQELQIQASSSEGTAHLN